jgi:hypothetical protein
MGEDQRKKNKRKIKGKTPKPAQFVISHCNIGINEDLFKTSFSSWRDAWLLDTGATCHMNFQRDFFEELNDNVDGVVNFADGSSLKPIGIGTIRLKLPGFQIFFCIMFSIFLSCGGTCCLLCTFNNKAIPIHMFDGKVEIRRYFDNMVIMIGWEDDKLLKLKGTSAWAHNLHTFLTMMKVHCLLVSCGMLYLGTSIMIVFVC